MGETVHPADHGGDDAGGHGQLHLASLRPQPHVLQAQRALHDGAVRRDHQLHEHPEVRQEAQRVEHPQLGCGEAKASYNRVRLPNYTDEAPARIKAGATSSDQAPPVTPKPLMND